MEAFNGRLVWKERFLSCCVEESGKFNAVCKIVLQFDQLAEIRIFFADLYFGMT